MIENPYTYYDNTDDDLLFAAEISWRGIAIELQELHYLHGARFVNQLKLITYYGDFHPVEGEMGIFSTGGEKSEDYANLLNAALVCLLKMCSFILKQIRMPEKC